jgi:hypothetical protein
MFALLAAISDLQFLEEYLAPQELFFCPKNLIQNLAGRLDNTHAEVLYRICPSAVLYIVYEEINFL